MATRMTRPGRLLSVVTCTVLAVAGCTSPQRPSVQAEPVALPTPLRSYDAAVAATIGQLDASVTTAGLRLITAERPYRPSEPPSLLQVPRVLLRADLADPDDGFVIIYDTADSATATQRAQELADYLGSGFGQTNFTADTQFSVAVLGETIVFTSWSHGRSSDPEQAEAAFDAIAAVGDPIAVVK